VFFSGLGCGFAILISEESWGKKGRSGGGERGDWGFQLTGSTRTVRTLDGERLNFLIRRAEACDAGAKLCKKRGQEGVLKKGHESCFCVIAFSFVAVMSAIHFTRPKRMANVE